MSHPKVYGGLDEGWQEANRWHPATGKVVPLSAVVIEPRPDGWPRWPAVLEFAVSDALAAIGLRHPTLLGTEVGKRVLDALALAAGEADTP